MIGQYLSDAGLLAWTFVSSIHRNHQQSRETIPLITFCEFEMPEID
jgi:hypothetical protein